MTIPEILEALTTYTGQFPEAAVRAAIEQREAITPELLRVLEAVGEDPAAYAQKDKHMLHTFAVYLLAYFREKRAFRPTLRILSGPGEALDDLFGDTLTERMSNILASMFDGDPEPLRRLVEDDRLNVWARSAAIESFVVLAASGQLQASEVAQYFGELFAGRLPRTPGYVWDALADAVGHLPAPELLDAVKQSFEEDLHEDNPSGFKYIVADAEMSRKSRAKLMAERYDLIRNTVDEMSWWAAFDEEENAKRRRAQDGNVPRDDAGPREVHDAGSFGDVEKESADRAMRETGVVSAGGQFVRQEPKVGRNDPCPCGSGKKFKKCCLGKPSGTGEG